MKQMKQKTQLSKRQKEFLEIFKKQMCLVSKSCEASKTTRAMYYRWLKEERFNDAVEETKTSIKDFGEFALYKLIKEGNAPAVIFFNKCKNRDRGYAEKQEIEITRVNILTEEEKEAEIKRLLS